MATIKKLLKSAPRMRGVTPVPNGPLVKKKGSMKGSTLKKGGTVKAQRGRKISFSTPARTKMTVIPATPVVDEEVKPKPKPSTTPPPRKTVGWHYAGAMGPVWDESGRPLTEEEYIKVTSPEKQRRGGAIKRSKLKNGGKTPAWQRKEGKNPSGGLNAKGVASYRRANPGSKLKTAVTTKPSKLKKGSKAANRRKSFCARMSGMKKRLTSAKTANDPNSRINKSLRKWNC